MTDAEKLEISERRDRFWQAIAILAAYGKMSKDEVLLAGLAQIWSGPPESEVQSLVERARACRIDERDWDNEDNLKEQS